MKAQSLILVFLAAVGTSALLSNVHSLNPAICKRARGTYDVCDTLHSFVRCRGHEAILITDCRLSTSTYCQVINGRGRCDGTSAPDLANEAPSCEAVSPSPAS
ncbi:hypothetical protein F4825DRAFT_304217 [Nemania diffusa]|nr:hypothetical protein F4825DRAFT_304217 [Nemania diffusa]